MDNQVVRRRVNTIASHLGAHEDILPAATHLFPMSCSGSLNTIIQRRDNRMYFARQSSASQGYFMRQASNEQEICEQSSIPSKSTGCVTENPYACDAPLFSKPTARQEHMHNVRKLQSPPQACNYHQPTTDFPTFAKPSMTDYRKEQRKQASKGNGFKWSPRMDVAESGNKYAVTLELPGVKVSDIRVEINDKNLRVSGNRSITWQKTANCSTNSMSAYHKREIFEGPYQIEWPLPENVNKDNISAELVDGLLMIMAPKLSTACSRQLKKNI